MAARLPWVYEATIGTLRGLMSWYLRAGHRSFAAAAGRIRVPTLVVWGTRDRLVDVRLSRRAAAAYPGALATAGPRRLRTCAPDGGTRGHGAGDGGAMAGFPAPGGGRVRIAGQDHAGRAVAVVVGPCGNLVA